MSLYSIDLFISYAHIDNQPVSAAESGWISRFHASLDAFLSMRLGKSVRIWRDDKLTGNDRFADEIVQQFNSTAMLLSVVTPRYLNSEWCTREVREFCERADSDLVIDQKARIFKVIKTPVDCEGALPAIMQEMLGYEFFVFEDGAPMELDAVYGQQYGQDFNRQISKLAFEMAALLKRLESETTFTKNTSIDANVISSQHSPDSSESAAAPKAQVSTAVELAKQGSDEQLIAEPVATSESISASGKPVIYLAECTFDVKPHRDVLETQLRCLGYEVLPDQRLPGDEAAYVDEVSALLQRCDVSVHLVGQKYGAVPDGPDDDSTALIQNRVAAQYSKSSGLQRLVWVDQQCQIDDVKQQSFVDTLLCDADAQYGADVLTGDLEALKSVLQRQLDRIEQRALQTEAHEALALAHTENPCDPSPQDQSVYLICTEQDRKATVPLRKYLLEHNVSVAMPAFKGDAAEVRKINQQLLLNCTTVLVFYGQGEETWKRSIDTEIRKLPGWLQGRPMPATFTYLAAPMTCDKEDMIDMQEHGSIDGIDQLAESALDTIFEPVSAELSMT